MLARLRSSIDLLAGCGLAALVFGFVMAGLWLRK